MLPKPEQIAQRLLARTALARPPINLDKVIAIWSNLSVVEEELDGSGYLLPLGKLGAEIVVNKSDAPERRRFTIAHELGHWVLGLIWQKKSGEFQQPPQIPRADIEKWCDSFATNLLMPSELVRPWVSEWRKPTLIDTLLRACQTFNVSEQAFFIRVWELSKVQVATLKSRSEQHGGDFEVEQNFAGRENQERLSELLQAPAVQTQIRLGSPIVFFSGTGRGSSFYCSGRRLPGNRVIMAIGWGEEGRCSSGSRTAGPS